MIGVRILFEDCNKRQRRTCCKKAEHVKLQWGCHPPLSRDKSVALIVLQKPCHRKGAMEHNGKELKQEGIMVEVTR